MLHQLTTYFRQRVRQLHSQRRAFTLIELLVVILIIGILIAVAAPSFLGQQDKAKVSGLRQQEAVAYKAAKAATVSNATQGNFDTGDTLVGDVTKSEPELAAVISAVSDPGTANPGIIGVGYTTPGEFQAVGYTSNGTEVDYAAPNNGDVTFSAPSGPPPTYASVVLGDHPAAFWQLNEASGTTVVDSSGNGNNGTEPGDSSETLGAAGIVPSSSDTATTFDGTSAKVPGTDAPSTSLTVEAWEHTASNGDGLVLFAVGGGWYFNESPSQTYMGLNTAGGGCSIDDTSLMPDTTYYVALTYSSVSGLAEYINNVPVGSDSSPGCTGAIDYSAVPSVTSGAIGGGSSPYTVTVQDVAVYGTVLSPTQIAADYAAGE